MELERQMKMSQIQDVLYNKESTIIELHEQIKTLKHEAEIMK